MSSLACLHPRLPSGEEEAGGRGRVGLEARTRLSARPPPGGAPGSEPAEVSRLSPVSQHLDRQGEKQSAIFPVSLTSGDWGSYL